MKIALRTKVGAALVLASLLAACGSSSPTEQASSTRPTGPAPTGEPVKIMIIGAKNNPVASQENMFAAAQARVDYVNDSGGLGGRPLQLIVCDANLDPNLEAGCLDQAVSDNVAAIVGSMLLFTRDYSKLEAASIPLIATQSLSPGEIAYPHAYLLGNNMGWFKGLGRLVADEKNDTVAVTYTDTTTGAFANTLIRSVLDPAGVKVITSLAHAASSGDRSAEAASLARGNPSAVVLAGTAEAVVPLIQAVRQTGYAGRIYTYSSALPPSGVEALRDAGEGVRVVGRGRFLSDTGPEMRQYKDDILNYAPAGTRMDERGTNGWSSVELFAKVMANSAGSFTGQDVIAAFDRLTTPVEAGTFGPFLGAGTSCDTEYPTILNTQYMVGTIKDGQIVADTGKFESYC
ncbi:ABC transporter substrate-binding protein [Parafrankia sp. EUN1f]|uniref:ABC transporter substrate-binding protein n=1 Tax=Parafrankia sp. EUN1f TaxID=102897 RepID=UPI0001C46FBC|nr:ABC transporter substrate-binding protein [Parafrankia sp. EUN1f]EFC86751.1 ABC-type branched-chain amino acid transport systems periplasmic component-like protein [Parafrankia sp. EUN1f]